MGLSALLAPAVFGYATLFLCHWSRHWLNRQSGYKLFFSSVLVGWLLMAVSHALVIVANPNGHPPSWLPDVYNYWLESVYGVLKQSWFASFLPITEHVNVVATAFVVALAIPFLVNIFVRKTRSSLLIAQSHGDLLSCLLHNVSKRNNGLVEVTTESRKVYIGFASDDGLSSQSSEGERYFAIVPVFNGYRTKNHNIRLTTDYAPILAKHLGRLDFEDFSVIIPIREVVSARYYDQFVNTSQPIPIVAPKKTA